MTVAPESSDEPKPLVSKTEVKEDPDSGAIPAFAAGFAVTQIKKEEFDDNEPVYATAPLPQDDEKDGDMFDDVDGPEYVDLTYEGIAEVDGVNCFVCEEFKIRQIPKPVIVTRPLYQLFDCIESKHITLDPDYQREVVWDEGRAALLISSILMGYFIPPIIFNCVKKTEKLPNGAKKTEHKRICVDGKQRLTSIWKFMTGQIGFFDSNTPQKKWYFSHPLVRGRETLSHRNILPNAVKDFFRNQAFCCYEYDELTIDTEETMFQLVQRGVALTPAEKMRAMSTEWATFTKQYEDDYPLITNLSKQSRASGFRLVLTIFTMVLEVVGEKRKRSATPTLQASPQALSRILDDKKPINPEIKERFKAIFDRYESLVKICSVQLTATKYKVERDSSFDPAPIWLRGDDVNHVRTFSPLELVGTAVLITMHGDKRTDAELLSDIKQMRHYLRVAHLDLRVNAQCWMTTWDFISRVLELQWSGKFPQARFLTHEEARDRAREAAVAEKAAERAAARVAAAAARTAKLKKSVKASTAKERSPSPEVMFPNLHMNITNGESSRKDRVKYSIDSDETEDEYVLSDVSLSTDDDATTSETEDFTSQAIRSSRPTGEPSLASRLAEKSSSAVKRSNGSMSVELPTKKTRIK